MQDSYLGGDLKTLHRDLVALTQRQLRNVDRLWIELESRIEDFRAVLEERRRNETSRNQVLSGEVEVDEGVFSLNKEFQEHTIQLADSLDLDEIDSVKLLLSAQNENDGIDRSMATSAVILFQQRKQFLLECLRLVLHIAIDSDIDEPIRNICREIVTLILGAGDSSVADGPKFIDRCVQAIMTLEGKLALLAQREQGAIALGQLDPRERDELHAFEEQSMTKQHESICGVVILLVKANYSTIGNFECLVDRMSKLDRWGTLTIHYCPVILSFITQYGSPEGTGSLTEARTLHGKLMDRRDISMWNLRYLQAACQTWWLAEYSGWYSEPSDDTPLPGVDLDSEARTRSESFFEALKEGAFQCTLTLCSQITPAEPNDSAKSSLVSFLLQDNPLPHIDCLQVSPWFRLSVAEQLESFVDSLITNMPDTLRQFKSEEDEQRKRIYSNFRRPGTGLPLEQDMHLERFLVIASSCFTGRGDAAHSFWGDAESNLYGFLQWASRRQSTPCVSAFCELLRSISKGEEFATSAHRFLLEEQTGNQAKLRKRGSLSWTQILEELATFTSRVRDGSKSRNTRKLYEGKPDTDDIMEPESILMLENYLRLLAHLCAESKHAREWTLSLSTPHILELLCAFCTSAVPGRLQGCAFMAMNALLTAKTPIISSNIWVGLDLWAFGMNNTPSVSRPTKITRPSAWFEEVTTIDILASFDQLNEFTKLLSSLLHPFDVEGISADTLPFPESLGSSYRMSGVRPYIDLVMRAAYDTHIRGSDDVATSQVLSSNILHLIINCLGSFDEDKIVLAGKSTSRQDALLTTEGISSYLRLHPFSQVMEWLFDDRVVSWLFTASHVNVDEIIQYDPDSVQMQCVTYGVEVMNLILDLQSTYLDAVRPLLKDHSSESIAIASNTSFEEKLLRHPQVLRDIGHYAGSGDPGFANPSLALLAKLGSSRKFRAHHRPQHISAVPSNPLVSILQNDDYIESISRPLIATMEIDPLDTEFDSNDPMFTTKTHILDCVLQILQSAPGEPTLAHAILGFRCNADGIEVCPNGLFDKGLSLFHAIIIFATMYPDGHEDRILVGPIRLRRIATEILSLLWTSSLTSAYVLPELLQADFLAGLMIRQRLLAASSLWDELDTTDVAILRNEYAKGTQELLHLRRLLFDYAAILIRFVLRDGLASSQVQLLSILRGSITLDNNQEIPCPSVVDLCDFLDLQLPAPVGPPTLKHLANLDLAIYRGRLREGLQPVYEIELIESILGTRIQGLRELGQLQDSNVEQEVLAECAQLTSHAHSENDRSGLIVISEQALNSWCNLVALIVDIAEISDLTFDTFVPQIEQILTPKLEAFASEQDSRAIHIARLLRHLTNTDPLELKQVTHSNSNEGAGDRAYQVFRAALRSSTVPEIDSDLREVLNQICYAFLVQSVIPNITPMKGQQVFHAVKSMGAKYIESLCNEILEADGPVRVTAILLLDAYCMVGSMTEKSLVVDALVKNNFLQVLVEGIERIPEELRETGIQDMSALLVFYEAKFSLLLTITQTKLGASHILNAGIFTAIATSGLFSVDPDIGIEIDNPSALSKYYTLLLYITRIVVSTLVSHGSQNERLITAGKNFIKDNRALIVATFKRRANIGGVSFDDAGVDIEELVDLFTMLINITDYIEFEDVEYSTLQKRPAYA